MIRNDPARRVLWSIAPLVLAIGYALLAVRSQFPLPCPLRCAGGTPCPTCGVTRSLALLLHGHLRDSLAMNPAGVVAAAILIRPLLLLAGGWFRWLESRVVEYSLLAAFFGAGLFHFWTSWS